MRKDPQYTINNNITFDTIRLIGEQSEQIGIMSKKEALEKAQEEQKDLVLITAKAQPPIVKLISFSKFLYQEKKRNQQSKRGIKKSTIKDIKLSLFIGNHDLQRLVIKTQQFLNNGYQVRLNLLLKGRELGKKDMAFELLNKFISQITNNNISLAPKVQGRSIIAILSKKLT